MGRKGARHQEFVEQLKSSVDIVKVIGEYVRLRKAGAHVLGLCPFHNEKTPSFSVHAVHQFYKCFGCGAGGDVLKFVMEIEGISFYEALKLLAERNGIPMPKRSEYADAETKLRGGAAHDARIGAGRFRERTCGSAGGEATSAYIAKRGRFARDDRALRAGLLGALRPHAGAVFERQRFHR